MKNRKPLPRSTKPLKRSEPARKTRLNPSRRPLRARKADPAKRRWAKHRCDPFREWLKTQPCCVTRKRTGECGDVTVGRAPFWWLIPILVDPAHTRPRSLGANDLYECIPLSRHLHDEQERIGWPRFEKKYGIARKALAKQYADEWLATPEGAEYGSRYTQQEGA